ncbi:hypothetical protein [Corynebacterium bovis]|uniref:TadE-like protein n=1 Tax=Corynebacterium bovis TaxID=36808 RepID=A0A426Q4U9_9CORY|nr:hypothetical protein [Corynebacterium bovis]RRO91781.1 hypothetical protein CXF40_05640 [Corynebacterium bovis]RRQ01659.1 hypothetical protein CXF41_03420 [Corynebacterium bovis]RRQ03901.1 hypothetical protein CXF42_05805 [Corynebacterium bovis]RRQ04614.1 hypothetical protein CXF39_01280 [Corynebacterium bovis]RRQ08351.1 hypothetical protein CXF43_00715 [Corynebacterium bovis]
MRWTRGRSDAGYVTVEAALVLSAVTGVAALLIAGIVTGVAWIGAAGTARDAARAAALAGDPGGAERAATAIAGQRSPGATVTVTTEPAGVAGGPGEGATGDPGGGSGTGGLQVLRVTVQRRVALWSVTGEAAVVVEPGDGDGQGP